MADGKSLTNAFDEFSAARLSSPTLEQIWQESFGDEYARAARPNAFYPQTVLNKIVEHAAGLDKKGSKPRLLDIGCGHGLAAIYLAHRMGMGLFGIDVSPASIRAAQAHAKQQHVDSSVEAEFWVADATSTHLPDSSCAVATCLDVMLYFPDKLEAIREIYRVLQPGGMFAFTTWEQAGYNVRLEATQVQDYRELLEEAGLVVEVYVEVEGAREMQGRVFEGVLEYQEALSAEIGAEVTDLFIKMARGGQIESAGRRYVFGVGRKK